MKIQFTMNHKKVSADIAPDTVLYDLVRSLAAPVSSAGARPPTAACARCFWMMCRYCPALFWQHAWTDAA